MNEIKSKRQHLTMALYVKDKAAEVIMILVVRKGQTLNGDFV